MSVSLPQPTRMRSKESSAGPGRTVASLLKSAKDRFSWLRCTAKTRIQSCAFAISCALSKPASSSRPKLYRAQAWLASAALPRYFAALMMAVHSFSLARLSSCGTPERSAFLRLISCSNGQCMKAQTPKANQAFASSRDILVDLEDLR